MKSKTQNFMADYKQSEIGRIPEGWAVTRLGDEAITLIRGNKTINRFERVAFIPMEFVPDSGLFVKYEIRPKEQVKSFTYCERGDLLLAKITPSLENGKQGIVPDDVPNGFALATTEVFPILCKGIDRLFLFYILKFQKFRNKIISSMIGTTGRQRASKESVENLIIPLPPPPEQKKIAEVLSTIDLAIQKADSAITKTERLKRGLMQRLLTRGISPKKFKDSEIGRIPEGWEVVTLLDIGRVVTGKTPSTKNDDFWGGHIPFVTPADIRDTKRIVVTERCVTSKGATQTGGLLPKDTVLVVCIASIGKFAIASSECISNQQINAIVCNKEVANPDYVYYTLLFRTKVLQSYSGVAVVPIIKKSLFEQFMISLPPLPEQKKIAEILGAVDEKLGLERKRKEKLELIMKGLMNDLLTGRKRLGARE